MAYRTDKYNIRSYPASVFPDAHFSCFINLKSVIYSGSMKSIVIMKKNIYTTKKVLILAGGSIKGAFQAGAFQALIENGYRPDFIYGVSVGSLNGAFVCNEAGKQDIDSVENLDWNLIAQNLTSFWARNIAQPADIAVRTKDVSLFAHILFERFHGLLNTTPIQNLIKKTIEVHNLKKEPNWFSGWCC